MLAFVALMMLASCGGCSGNPGPGDPTPPPNDGGYSCAAPMTFPKGQVIKSASAIAGRYIVRFKVKPTIQPLVQAQDVGVSQVQVTERGFAARLAAQALQRMLADPNVEAVFEDGTKRVSPLAGVAAPVPWGLDRADQRSLPLDGIYEPGATGAGVNVAIIDTGITSHPDFASRLAAECFSAHSGGCADGHGHGTHVAATSAGSQYGIAKAATLYAVRVLDSGGSGSDSDVIRGIEWVAEKAKADPSKRWVANMSLGGSPAPALDQAVCDALAAGVVFAIAAGNEDSPAKTSSPARVIDAITVGASDRTDIRAYFSNYGPLLDLFAPGVDILSATPAGGSTTMSGTSMAAPHVAGAAALTLCRYPAATPLEVRDRLVLYASDGKVTDPGAGSTSRLLYVKED